MIDRKLQRKHSADAAADHCSEFPDAEMIEKQRIRTHDVTQRNYRQVALAAFRTAFFERRGARRAVARTEIIYTNERKFGRVQGTSVAHYAVPPITDPRAAGERVKHEHGICPCCIELAVNSRTQPYFR